MRRRRRAGFSAVVLALPVAVTLAACGGGVPGGPRLEVDDTARLRQARIDVAVPFVGVAAPDGVGPATVLLADASQRLAVDLVGAAQGDDVVVSPLGLQLVLAVLREGATGAVAAQIDAVAGLAGRQSVADLRARMDVYAGDVSTVDRDDPPERPLVHLAGAVMVQEGLEVGAAFLDGATRFHRAQVYETDFTGADATRLADAWVRRETGGMLRSAPLEPDPSTSVRVLDAVVLAASWETPFFPGATWDAPFTLADGSRVDVPTMHLLHELRYADGPGWRAVELPYTRALSMRLVVAEAAGPVDASTWAAAEQGLAGARRPTVALAVPRWRTDSVLQLRARLPGLGLGSLLAPAGGLDGIVPGAVVSDVAQAGTITVAERGTVAAVVTDVAVGGSAPPEPEVELTIDRPFEYRVVEDGTGLVLIAGRVADPS